MPPADLNPNHASPAVEEAAAGSPAGLPDASAETSAETSDLRDSAAVTGARSSRLPEDMVGAIWEQMRVGWLSGRPRRAEHFLTAEFLAGCGAEGAVDVIYGEYALAEAHGGMPRAADYHARFPQFASGLEKQLALHSAIELEPSEATYVRVAEAKSAGDLACPGPFGRYVLVAPLDSGGQANVYRAVHPDLGREVVLKIAKPAAQPFDPQQVDRLAAEAKILASLSHPNLAPIYDAGVIDGRAYLALEFIRGRTLAQFARQNRPPPDEAAKIVAQVARALAAVHARGILHLDIKPKNILIDEQGVPRLIDFGLSRLEHAWSAPAADEGLAGTLEFMAPEQARGESDRLGPATDLFSLGGVLYYLLTGAALFSAKNARDSLSLARKCEWNRAALEKCPASVPLRRCCERALAAEPADRFTSAEEFAAALERAGSPVRRRPALLLGLAALMILGLLPAFGYFTTKSPPAALPQLDVLVWQEGIRKDLSQAVPLLNGDEVRLQAAIPARSAAMLMLINSAGELRILQQVAAAATASTTIFPDAASAAPLTGEPGTEGLLLLTGSSLPSTEELKTWWRLGETAWPALAEHSLLRLANDRVTVEQTGRDLGDPVLKEDAEAVVTRRLAALQRRLQSRGTACDGYVFAHSR